MMAGEAAKNQDFEEPQDFPAPGEGEDEDALEIEILDDTPEEDQRGAAPAADRLDVDSEAFEAEVRDYSENAQKRIKAVKFEFHEERRAKESAQRQAEEATRFAETVARDNAALKQSLDNSNTVLVEQYGARNDAELEKARAEFKDAYDEGDTDKLLEAQEALSRLHAERVGHSPGVASPGSTAPSEEPHAQPAAAAQPAAGRQPPDGRAVKWMRENSWFQQPGSEDMTGYAVGVHQKLVAAGYNPAIHEEYYSKIDESMRAVFPDKFSPAALGETERPAPAVTQGSKSPPVGGPSRGGSSPRKVQLTATQVALAKRLGLTNKQYAAQVMKEQRADG